MGTVEGRKEDRKEVTTDGYKLQENRMDQSSSSSFFLTRKERIMEDITLLSLCVFMRCLLITVAATQVSFECVVSPEITQRSPHPTIQYVDEGTEPKRGKAACPVFDSGSCRDFVV